MCVMGLADMDQRGILAFEDMIEAKMWRPELVGASQPSEQALKC